MNHLQIERAAADRVAFLHAEASRIRATPSRSGTVAKRAATLLRNWAARLDREHVSAAGGLGHTADLPRPGRLGHQRA